MLDLSFLNEVIMAQGNDGKINIAQLVLDGYLMTHEKTIESN